MSVQEKFPFMAKSVNLSHHLSETAKGRKVSPLKGIQKHIKPGAIMMAGGLPSPDYFPIANIHVDALVPNSYSRKGSTEASFFGWFWSMFGKTEKTERYTIPKFGAHDGDIDLAKALQYGPATGSPALAKFIREFTAKVYGPIYSDWTTLAHSGNTDGIARCAGTFLNPGEYILVEELTYPSALACFKPAGVKILGVGMDAQGMSAVILEHILSTWDETTRGAKRPHVMYTIPIGQNPTGSTMGLERKKVIYDLCVKYDIIIIEDDPYYFLQEGIYQRKEVRAGRKAPKLKKDEDEGTRFINSLIPTYLKLDYQGRVIRLETFSKVIAPGSRMGWFVCNPLFAERLERQGETTVSASSGFSQSIIMQLIVNHWGPDNYIRWLQGLQGEYTARRDYMVDCIFELFDVQHASPEFSAYGAGLPIYTAYLKRPNGKLAMTEKQRYSGKTALFTFVPPSAGMFVWLKFSIKNGIVLEDGETLSEHLYVDLANNGLVVALGDFFVAEPSTTKDFTQEVTFRLSFSLVTQDAMRKALEILADVLQKYV
ncbi:PLP-dependent transferase [Hysterangium stoloniferum]|nr:PLP-dependent transferase [Hysterangium stoloniferum]